jgi:DNA ligase-associated metallophosphoesterase
MEQQVDIQIDKNSFTLYSEKIALWHQHNILLLSDVHAGKASHFRKHGIPLSSDYLLKDLNRLEASIKRLMPSKVMVLGDLFHSDHNEENALVEDWIQHLEVPFYLINGNHDVHSNSQYNINYLPYLELDNILLLHDPHDDIESTAYRIGGHLHPAYRIKGKARQSISFPCFHIGKKAMILPAYGQLTGKKSMRKMSGDKVVLVTEDGLIGLN